MDLQALKQPIKYQWKIQTVSQTSSKAQCVAYIDARDVMDLLDLVVKPENWQDKYEVVGDKFIAGIGIKKDNEWIWKWDTGTAGDFEQEKSIFSDSFKRAAVKWGIGRFLYDLDFRWINTDKPGKGAHPVDENGKRIYNLTEYFEKIGDRVVDPVPKQTTTSPKPATAPKEYDAAEAALCRIHQNPDGSAVKMTHYEKDGREWWSHKTPNGGWCTGTATKYNREA